MPTALQASSKFRSVRSRRSVEAAAPESGGSVYGSMDIGEVWKLYAAKPTEEIRNFLWERYLPIVRYNAERIHARLPDEVDVEDLVQAGMFGLMGAISAFQLDKNVKFETYCARRVQGAILDELRAMDWVPRLVRSRATKVENVRRAIETETGQPATDEQIAARLGVGDEEFEKIRRDSKPVSTMSITRKATDGHGGETRDLEVMRDGGDNPVRVMQSKDLRDLLTKGLSRAERLIVILYYYENMTMKEIGATLALSESRVSQMHSAILERLKAQMQHRTRELEPVE